MKLLAEDEQAFEADDDWYFPVGAGIIAVAIAVGVAAQHHAIAPPGSPAFWAALAALPWIFDALLFPIKRIGTPIWLFVPVVLAAVGAIQLDPVTIDFAPFFLVLLTAEMASRLRLAGGLVVFAAAVAVMLGLEIWSSVDDSFVWIIGITLGWMGGFAIQAQLRLTAEMRASQERLAAQAVTLERQRIAREVHDVVAHTLSVTMLHLTGARLALDRGDWDEATAALLQAEEAGRESLADIRATVNVLTGDETGRDAPMPTACDLPDLVSGFRAAGLDVDLDVRGDAAVVPTATGLAIYRIVQESLANVVKHAPGAAATVCLAVDTAGVRLTVADAGNGIAAPPGDGRGIEGMRERAELLGGSLRAGRSDCGWVVDATLPGPTASRRRHCG
ncbi:MAG: sensor histidine kinase [Acidimicrobiia bacterium]